MTATRPADRVLGAGASGARLRGMRLQGFKSFAERTVLEFGPGISAVVGPNGSGKSNLADALRWTLGEQGKALRSRKSEDVIFAGSEKRSALGMADVTLVIDNADGLLPVEYESLEIGRRLYRSGENDYLLNKQRLRLRDLIDLLDAAHLADNAFLFIGQGMVDQVLALRPEDRRPLFEEVAGVRRHERRRRKAEEQLTEAEANLSRVEDILAELRPQARRLAAQAEQQASRLGAGEELAAGLLLAAHVRWHDAAVRVVAATGRLEATREESSAALAALQAEEEAAAAIAASLGERAEREAERREAHDAARGVLTALQMRSTRLTSELEAIGRDRERATVERAAADASRAQRRRELSEPPPARDLALEERAGAAERALAEALAELTSLRAADRERGDEIAALRRAEAARQAELDGARRRIGEATRRLGEERTRRDEVVARRTELEARQAASHDALEAATVREAAAAAAREAARTALETLEGRKREADDAAGTAGSKLASLRGRLEALVARAAEEEARGIAKAAKKRGGRRLDEALQVDPGLRAAVEAALGEAARAYLVVPDAVAELATERGLLVVDRGVAGVAGGAGGVGSGGAGRSSVPSAFRDKVAAVGGGFLGDAIRSDGTGAAKLLLSTVAWVPDLDSLLGLQPALPDGWLAVARDGSAVASRHTIALGKADAALERRAEVERLSGQVETAVAESERGTAAAAAIADEVRAARSALDAARQEEAAAGAARRRAEEEERAAARSLEQVAREAAWLDAQVVRLETETTGATGALGTLETAATSAASASAAAVAEGADAETAAAIAAWETRVGELRTTRDRVAAELAEAERIRREIEAVRARAEASAAMDEERIVRADRELATLAERERALGEERETIARETAAATVREEAAREALGELRAADAADRERLASAEAAAGRARDRLRTADERHRAAEVADLEARLGLDAIREQLLVELAGLGELALRTLGVARAAAEEDDGSVLEAALTAKAEEWASTRPEGEPPSTARLATLRRRYHDLGAGNPFAVDEYEELKERLATLETQERDLREAIAKTRELIEELDRLISVQFRETFAQLETAFDSRFQQLFGGGFAKLSLTDPADLGTTGIEIVARPPGKKAQSLSMLSGGERALTAVALLFAMLEVRPVPFCVLDEVDAALDEANVGRFGEALRGLAARTQFIVITHNRGTIEAADALYGVTVGDDSVSRVISLRLEEAQALAADRARSHALVEG